MEVAVLTWLVGRRLRLCEAVPDTGRSRAATGAAGSGTAATGVAGAGRRSTPATSTGGFEVVVIARDGPDLRVACSDGDVVQLDGLTVVGEAGTGAELVRLVGSLHMAITDRTPVIATLSPERPPEQLQRRQWVRVKVALPVRYRLPSASPLHLVGAAGDCSRRPGEGTALAVDLSGGGVRLSEMPPLHVGADLVLELALDSGPVEVDAEVLGRLADGTVRLRFVRVPEAVSQRILRQVFAVQMRRRRLLPVEP